MWFVCHLPYSSICVPKECSLFCWVIWSLILSAPCSFWNCALYLLPIWGLHCCLIVSDLISSFFFCMGNLKNFTYIYSWGVVCLCKAYGLFYFYLYLEKEEDPLHPLFFPVLHPAHHSVSLNMAEMTFIHLCLSLGMLLPPHVTSSFWITIFVKQSSHFRNSITVMCN